LDDTTETIRLKAWREESEELAEYQIGDIIDIVGKVRQQEDGEIFIVPEDIFKIEDINIELLRELEILELRTLMGGKPITKPEPEKKPEKPLEKEPEITEPIEEIEKQPPKESEVDIRNEVMNLIRTLDTGKGASYKELVEQSDIRSVSEDVVETIILDLLNEGVIYEPEPGRYKEL
jgi:hypothetical protein